MPDLPNAWLEEAMSREAFEEVAYKIFGIWVEAGRPGTPEWGVKAIADIIEAAASSLKQAEPECTCPEKVWSADGSDMNESMCEADHFEHKQAEPPSQPAMSAELDELVRDLTKVGPRPKSEVRRRILALAEAYSKHVISLTGKHAAARKGEVMKSQRCNHKTRACCSICGCCFACCNCRLVAKKIFDFANRIQKRDKWFIGGYLGTVMEEWEAKYGEKQ